MTSALGEKRFSCGRMEEEEGSAAAMIRRMLPPPPPQRPRKYYRPPVVPSYPRVGLAYLLVFERRRDICPRAESVPKLERCGLLGSEFIIPRHCPPPHDLKVIYLTDPMDVSVLTIPRFLGVELIEFYCQKEGMCRMHMRLHVYSQLLSIYEDELGHAYSSHAAEEAVFNNYIRLGHPFAVGLNQAWIGFKNNPDHYDRLRAPRQRQAILPYIPSRVEDVSSRLLHYLDQAAKEREKQNSEPPKRRRRTH